MRAFSLLLLLTLTLTLPAATASIPADSFRQLEPIGNDILAYVIRIDPEDFCIETTGVRLQVSERYTPGASTPEVEVAERWIVVPGVDAVVVSVGETRVFLPAVEVASVGVPSYYVPGLDVTVPGLDPCGQ